MANPPAVVKLALESMCLLLSATPDSENAPDWKTIRSILQKDSFIPSIINFDTTTITYANSKTKKRYTIYIYINFSSRLYFLKIPFRCFNFYFT